jgi:hypothetical protein
MTNLALQFMRGEMPVVVGSKVEFGSFKKWLERNGILDSVFPKEEDRKFETWVKLGEINYRGHGPWGPFADQTLTFCIRADKGGGLGVDFGYQQIKKVRDWYGSYIDAKMMRKD